MPRKRKTTRNMKGKGIREILGKIHDFVKKNKLISRGLTAVTPFAGSFSPLTAGAATGAAALGYGRKRRPKKRK